MKEPVRSVAIQWRLKIEFRLLFLFNYLSRKRVLCEHLQILDLLFTPSRKRPRTGGCYPLCAVLARKDGRTPPYLERLA